MRIQPLIFFVLVVCGFWPVSVFSQNSDSDNMDILEEAHLRFNQPDSNLRAQLIAADENFITLHPTATISADLLFHLINLYRVSGKTSDVLFNSFKLIIVYGQSPHASYARNMADSILAENLNAPYLPKHPEMLNTVYGRPAEDNFRLAYLDFISFLHAVEIPVLDRRTMDDIQNYQRLFVGADPNDFDAVLSWQGDIYKRNKLFVRAWIAWQQLITAYPQSTFTASGHLRLAHLALEQFRNPTEARHLLLELINQLSESATTADAQYFLAQIFDFNLKQKDEALNNYLLLVKAFPDCPFRADALLRAGKLYSESQKYDEALAVYMQVVEDYNRAPQVSVALQRIIYLDKNIFKNPQQASRNLLLLAQLFPQRGDAPAPLRDAARIMLSRPKKKNDAREILKELVKTYPNTKQARSAKKLLK